MKVNEWDSSDEGVFGQFAVCEAAIVGQLNDCLYSSEDHTGRVVAANKQLMRRECHHFVIFDVGKFYDLACFSSLWK